MGDLNPLHRAFPRVCEGICIGDVVFDLYDTGREVARRGTSIIGEIVPHAMKPRGGFATRLPVSAGMPTPAFFRRRAEARQYLAERP